MAVGYLDEVWCEHGGACLSHPENAFNHWFTLREKERRRYHMPALDRHKEREAFYAGARWRARQS